MNVKYLEIGQRNYSNWFNRLVWPTITLSLSMVIRIVISMVIRIVISMVIRIVISMVI
jgi:hypothetical protein